MTLERPLYYSQPTHKISPAFLSPAQENQQAQGTKRKSASNGRQAANSLSLPPLNLTIISLSMYFAKSKIFSFFGFSAPCACGPPPPLAAPPRPRSPPPPAPRPPPPRPLKLPLSDMEARVLRLVVVWLWLGWRHQRGQMRVGGVGARMWLDAVDWISLVNFNC